MPAAAARDPTSFAVERVARKVIASLTDSLTVFMVHVDTHIP